MTFGDRLRKLRVKNNMTQEALANRLSLEKMSISKYESGKMFPSSSTLIALCQVFGVGADYFFREYDVHISASPQYRMNSKAKLTKSEMDKILIQTENAVGNLQEISEICEYKGDTSSLESLRRVVQNNDDIEKLAEEVRYAWFLGLDPIENLMEVSENHGFTIILVDGPASFDAAVFIDDEYGPVIALRRGVPKDRQRFTLAHELGHYFILNNESNSTSWDSEMKANRFAAALLIPSSVLMMDMGGKRSILGFDELYMLHQKYGVSISALLVRMESLGLISNDLVKKLNAYDRTAKNGKNLGESHDKEEPRLVRKLVYRAVAEGYITGRKGSELLEDGFFGSSSMGVNA